jgi:acyl-CoA thioester hydrolase
MEQIYRWEAIVRDYELDSQNIVNHATYVNYFEQCRNDYARSLGIDFIEYHKRGFDLLVAGIDIQYWRPLRVKDQFYVTVQISACTEKRVHFKQEIRLKETDRLLTSATVYIACVDLKTGRACMPESLKEKLLVDYCGQKI